MRRATVIIVGTALVAASIVLGGLTLGSQSSGASGSVDNQMAIDADPSTPQVDTAVTRYIGQSFDVSTNITAAPTAYAGYEMAIEFDSTVLDFVSQGETHIVYTSLGDMDLFLTATLQDRDDDGFPEVEGGAVRVSGTTTVATGQANLVHFQCKAPGITTLHLMTLAEDAMWATFTIDGAGGTIATDLTDASVTCAVATPTPMPTPTPTPIPTISHLAGQYKTPGYSPPGDGGQAQNAKLNDPHGLYETADHTLYFADTGNGRIRRIQPRGPAGTITTVAGSATPGYCGDGGAATIACLDHPRDVFVDSDGNIFIADTGNNRIRRVDASTGKISTVAGTGTAGYYPPGDGGPATSAQLNSPRGVAVDTAGNIYIADTVNNRIRKVSASTGNITTIAGNGTAAYCGDGGAATSACLNQPHDVYPWGTMYAGTTDLLIADTGNNVIRWLHGPSGIINTLAGSGAFGFSGDDGPAAQAQLKAPEAVASDASLAVFVADTQNDRIRRVAFGETTISTVVGGGDGSGCAASHTEPYYGCPATDAILNEPAGVATGGLNVSDSGSATLGGYDPYTGEPTGSFSNAAGGCSGGMATIDWAFVVVVLGLILARRQVNGLLMRIRGVARPAPGRGRAA